MRYAVEARYDAVGGKVMVKQTPIEQLARDDSAAAGGGIARMTPPPPATPLIIGLGYNGKIEVNSSLLTAVLYDKPEIKSEP